MPPAVRISPSPAIASVVTPTTMPSRHAGHHVGIAGLADAGDAAALDADVGLADAGPVDDERVGDHAVERVARRRRRPPGPCRRAAPCRRRTCTRRRRPWRPLRLRRRAACRRAGRDRRSSARRCRRSAAASMRWLIDARFQSRGRRSPARSPSRCRRESRARRQSRTSVTVLVSPGSNRTAVPAGMSRRMP